MEENLKEKWMDESSIFLRDIYAFCKQFIDEFNLNNKDNDLSKNAVTNYLVEWVKLLDSVGILFYEGRVDTAQILTRSMFEIQLQLCYLIKESDELEEKAAFIYVVSNLKRYWFNKNRIENFKKINKDYSTQINSDIIAKLESNDGIIKTTYEYIQNKHAIDKSKWNQLSWFKLYSEKHGEKCNNNRSLCEEISFYDVNKDVKILMYDIIYDKLSQKTHGAECIDNMIFENGVQKYRNYNCLQHGYWQLHFIFNMLLCILYHMFNCFKSNEFSIDSDELGGLHVILKKLEHDFNNLGLEKAK